jgi:hypothetical protein
LFANVSCSPPESFIFVWFKNDGGQESPVKVNKLWYQEERDK